MLWCAKKFQTILVRWIFLIQTIRYRRVHIRWFRYYCPSWHESNRRIIIIIWFFIIIIIIISARYYRTSSRTHMYNA